MTFEERVHALSHLRLTDRQTRFLVTVALHSGYCLRRQYLTFAGVRYGKNVRDFLDGLVFRGLALRFTYRLDRGHVYHVHARSIYRALAQDDNRNRRVASPALIARKLMLLDFALTEPQVEWFVTEADKVELFATRFGVSADDLPHRTFDADAEDGGRTRYFVDKLPIYLAGEPSVPHFVYLASDPSPQPFEQFLRERARLFARLGQWAVICVKPPHCDDVTDLETAFRSFTHGGGAEDHERLRRLFLIRRLVEDGQLGRLSADDLRQYRQARSLYAKPSVARLYSAWLVDGDGVVADGDAATLTTGQLLARTLPHAYEQFGSMAGVA
jgi:hypothetical protein